MEKVKYMLANEGVLLYNRLNLNENNFMDTQLFNNEVFQKTFPESKEIFVKTNIILSNRNDIFIE